MISKKMATALNTHLNMELYSAQLYLSMSSYANFIGLKGAANWFMVQYQEEMVHFMKFYGYIKQPGGACPARTDTGAAARIRLLHRAVRKDPRP